jgi:hypothetical protein
MDHERVATAHAEAVEIVSERLGGNGRRVHATDRS